MNQACRGDCKSAYPGSIPGVASTFPFVNTAFFPSEEAIEACGAEIAFVDYLQGLGSKGSGGRYEQITEIAFYRRPASCGERLKMRWYGVVTGVFEPAAPNKAGLRDVIPVGPKAVFSLQELPRYVQTRRLAGGQTAFYWCRLWWARGKKGPFRNEPLGVHLDKMRALAEVLNDQLDAWRIARKS